mmetsp:Transcript_13530/g.24923  ORF Transcript_13530/g.24923 Transcript_13530/m.24923 type:complete len:221 (-) Transcript_13530:788-1450(-)
MSSVKIDMTSSELADSSLASPRPTIFPKKLPPLFVDFSNAIEMADPWTEAMSSLDLGDLATSTKSVRLIELTSEWASSLAALLTPLLSASSPSRFRTAYSSPSDKRVHLANIPDISPIETEGIPSKLLKSSLPKLRSPMINPEDCSSSGEISPSPSVSRRLKVDLTIPNAPHTLEQVSEKSSSGAKRSTASELPITWVKVTSSSPVLSISAPALSGGVYS